MNESIYLIVDRQKVVRMTKSLGKLMRGEIPVKLNVTVKPEAFREPVIEREVVVDDWTEGIDISDVSFEKNVITEDEAKIIRGQRLLRMKEILESNGYDVQEIPDEA